MSKNIDQVAQAYKNAQKLLEEKENGLIGYDRLIASIEEVKEAFPMLISGQLLHMFGNQFFWKRQSGQPLILYAINSQEKKLQSKGLVELCQLLIPEKWVGCGRFKIDWPDTAKENDPTTILISLYLYSTDDSILKDLIPDDDKAAAYLVSLFLNAKDTENFYQLAEERFESLR